MSVADALSFENFMNRYRPPMPAEPRPDPLAQALTLTERYREGEAFTQQERSSCSNFFLFSFRCGKEALLGGAVEALAASCPDLFSEPYPRTLLTALCLDPAFRTPALLELLGRREDGPVLLLPCGAPWTGPKGLLRSWDVLPKGLYPALDRNLELPEKRANHYLGLVPAGAEDPLYSLDPVDDLESILEQLLRCCTVVGEAPEGRLSTLGALAAAHLSLPCLLAALEPGGLLHSEDPQALAAFAGTCPAQRKTALLSAV